MEYNFECVLIDRDFAKRLVMALNRPEPSGYGAVPYENANLLWGIEEKNTGLFLTKGLEKGEGIDGDHKIIFAVKCKEGFFSVWYSEINVNGKYGFDINSGYDPFGLLKKYSNEVYSAIDYYINANHDDFFKLFEKTYGEDIYSAEKRIHKEITADFKRIWNL